MNVGLEKTVIDPLRAGTLDLDCSEIRLTQEVAEHPRVFRGPGYIRQGEDGELVFKIYPSPDGPLQREIEPLGTPGVLIPPNRFYAFTASDAHGNTWKGSRVLPEVSVSYLGPRAVGVVQGKVHGLATEGKPVPAGAVNTMTLRFFTDQDIPCHSATVVETNAADHHLQQSTTVNLVTITSCGCDFLLTRQPGEVTLEVWSHTPFPLHFDTRITEALQFVLARSFQLRVLEREAEGKRIVRIASPLPQAKSRLQAPISLKAITARYWTWVLFDRYLRFILPHAGEDWHPCSAHLAAVCESSAASIDAEILALGVAVEGLTRTLFPDLAPIPDDFRGLVTSLQAHIRAWLKDNEPAKKANLPDRVQNITGMLLEVRPADRLQHLVRDGVIEKLHIDAWKGLRNAAAHAAEPGTREWQQLLDRRDLVLALLYRLVFHAIGYEGRCSDYGTRHWPVVEFPQRETTEEAGQMGRVVCRTRAFGRLLQWTGHPAEGLWDWSVSWPDAEAAEESGAAATREDAAKAAHSCGEWRQIRQVVREGSGPV